MFFDECQFLASERIWLLHAVIAVLSCFFWAVYYLCLRKNNLQFNDSERKHLMYTISYIFRDSQFILSYRIRFSKTVKQKVKIFNFPWRNRKMKIYKWVLHHFLYSLLHTVRKNNCFVKIAFQYIFDYFVNYKL